MTEATQLRTVKQLAKELRGKTGGFSEGTLRHLIFNASTNGFESALVRIGRRIFIDVPAFNAWLQAQRKAAA